MKRKKHKLRYKKERVVFSDVLPYETPLIFSNRYFYRFLVMNGFQLEHSLKQKKYLLSFHSDCPLDAYYFACLLFGLKPDIKKYKLKEHNEVESRFQFDPYIFSIAHKDSKLRELAVIHPFNQISVVAFYEKYKSLILYHCNVSNFSLRKPNKVAQYFYYRDRLHASLLGEKADSIELYFNEYENLKTYFSYQKYSNIYKFYEDYRYQRAEKKFSHMLVFDIQSCFDSIYTHSIAWATNGGKDKVKQAKNFDNNTFGDAFDDLMESINARETNGILIGPEFSRIFAEIILQFVDKKVEQEVAENENGGYYQNKDYECYRYVDDYFLFYNDEEVKSIIVNTISKLLRVYKMSISDAKTKHYERPFVTEVTKAKIRIDSLILKIFLYNSSQKTVLNNDDEKSIDADSQDNEDNLNEVISGKIIKTLNEEFKIFINPKSVIASIKCIVDECKVPYKDISNYMLNSIGTHLDKLLRIFEKRYRYFCAFSRSEDIDPELSEKCVKQKAIDQKMIINYLISIIDVCFFIFDNNKRVNTSLKLLNILNTVILYVKNNSIFKKNHYERFENYLRDMVLKKIQDEIFLTLQSSLQSKESVQESYYLLIALKELGTNYLLNADVIKKTVEKNSNPSMFSETILLYYYSGHKQYDILRCELIERIKKIIIEVDSTLRARNSQLVILSADILTCPFVNDQDKRDILYLMGFTDLVIQNQMIKFARKQKYIFTKWTKFNLNKEISAKISQEVYS